MKEKRRLSFRKGKTGENRRLRQERPNSYEAGSDFENNEVTGKF